MKTALITGCGSGFGARLARRLHDDGHRVIATDPDPSTLSDLAGSPTALVLRLDVTEPQSVTRAVEAALAWSPPDVLVNNGGYAVFGTQEEADLDAARAMFDVNVFGVARLTQALLPTLRERSGLVVQLSSVAGRTVFPESGWYAASKHAIEAMSEALFQECCAFGVRVRLIEPGSFATNFLERARAASLPRDPSSPYAALHPLWDARKVELLEPPQDPDLVVDAIVACLDDPTPFKRVPVGPDATRMLALRELIGADPYALLAAHRNGLAAPSTHDGAVLSAREVLDAWSERDQADAEDFVALLEPTLLALHLGHLRHWEHDPIGQQALTVLTRLAGAVE